MVVYVMIICKTQIYIWNMVVKIMNMIICKTAIYILHVEHVGWDNNFVVDKTNLAFIKFVKWHNQQKPMSCLTKLIEGMNNLWHIFLLKIKANMLANKYQMQQNIKIWKMVTFIIICWVLPCFIICPVKGENNENVYEGDHQKSLA
jgi:hypothetical protein